MMKPKHQGGYSEQHAELCERTLVTLLRGLGPWKSAVYLIGGLVPRYLIGPTPDSQPPPHAGTADVDIVLDLPILAEVDAYNRLEQNLRKLEFKRGTNDENRVQHHSWRKSAGEGVTIVVDLLCDASVEEGGQVVAVPGERRLSALKIPGAHLVAADYVEVRRTAELLEERGVATETIRVANIVPFIVLKALAYEDRSEEKDAYDLIYCLMHYHGGAHDVAEAFAKSLFRWSGEPLLSQAIEILRSRFATDAQTEGSRKNGPRSYARFLTDPGQSELDLRHRQDAAGVVEDFLNQLDTFTSENLGSSSNTEAATALTTPFNANPYIHVDGARVTREGDRYLAGLSIAVALVNVGSVAALSIRAYLRHAVLKYNPTIRPFHLLGNGAAMELNLGPAVESSTKSIPQDAELWLEYRDPGGQWWTTEVPLRLGVVLHSVAGYSCAEVTVVDQQERFRRLSHPRIRQDTLKIDDPPK